MAVSVVSGAAASSVTRIVTMIVSKIICITYRRANRFTAGWCCTTCAYLAEDREKLA